MTRPSSRDEPGGAPGRPREDGLLGGDRRRLPPGVDVVELAGGLLAGAVALAGCSAPPDEVRAQAVDSKTHVLDVSRDVLSRLTALGSFKSPTLGTWSGCDDIGGRVMYHVTGRLDPAPETARPLADRVVATLQPAGWRLEPVRPGEDDPVTLEAVRGDVNVQFSGYASQPFVVFDISGPCLEVGDLDVGLMAEKGETLTVT
ncbi:MAG TPA: hypothetical protein VF227_09680 [Actinomycetes bacterium]